MVKFHFFLFYIDFRYCGDRKVPRVHLQADAASTSNQNPFESPTFQSFSFGRSMYISDTKQGDTDEEALKECKPLLPREVGRTDI